jgi:hypothetical protein
LVSGPTGNIQRDASERHAPAESSMRSCLGILRLAQLYSSARLEAAAARAVGSRSLDFLVSSEYTPLSAQIAGAVRLLLDVFEPSENNDDEVEYS